MTNARLISSFTLTTSNNRIRGNYNGGATQNIDIAAGTYYWGCDGGATDFAAAFKTALEAAFGGTTFTVQVIGVNDATAGYADGRVVISEASNDFEFEWSTESANITFDSRIVGSDGTSDESSSSSSLYSDWVHRYGWYPQEEPSEDLITSVLRNAVQFTSAGYRSGVHWTTLEVIGLAFEVLNSSLVRTAAAADSNRNAGLNLTVGDENCSFQCFGEDLANDSSRDFRYYDTITSYTTSDYKGPYTFPQDSPLWMDPLANSSPTHRAGELWTVALNGQESVT